MKVPKKTVPKTDGLGDGSGLSDLGGLFEDGLSSLGGGGLLHDQMTFQPFVAKQFRSSHGVRTRSFGPRRGVVGGSLDVVMADVRLDCFCNLRFDRQP